MARSGAKTDASVDSIVDTVNADGDAVVQDRFPPDDGAVARTELHEIIATTPSGRDDFEGRKTRRVDPRPGLDTPTISVDMPPGSALISLGSLWHGGGANRTDRSRLGVVLHYGVAWLRLVENHVLAIPPAVVAGVTPRMQELLGYNICSPFLGSVDRRHPCRLLDRPHGPTAAT